PATRQAGRTHNFQVEPQFASGPYALRFEAWAGEQVTATAETGPLMQVETQPRQFVAGPISRPTSANFADQMTLLGYDLPQRRTQAGGDIPVTLYWQALQAIGADLITFNQLVDDQGQVWGGRDRRPRDIYSTMLWAPGEVVSDPYTVAVDPATPDGIYYLHVGAYLPVGESYVTLPLMANGAYSEVTSVSIGPIKVGEAPADLFQTGSQPRQRLDQPFGDGPHLTLLGFDLTDETGQPITNNQLPITDVHVTLYWQSDRPLLTDYTTFVHLRDESGVVVAQKDQPPLNGAYPTSLWDPGEVIADNIVISLPEELPQGEYKLIVGMYDFLSDQRLMIPNHPADELELTGLVK
ncbi:MAG: hypothetical protein R3264_11990, partial [Anaerolineae bacterium]|nr:hypothetical protein [Anaerolineae bacterium]